MTRPPTSPFLPSRRHFLGALATLPLLAGCQTTSTRPGPWRSLFNRRDLSGWVIDLGHPPGQADTRDPRSVFQVVETDGEAAIRVSGEGLGGLRTTEEFGNYHLELQFKWGELRFPPRLTEPRDSGLLYHGLPDPNPETGWIESLELGLLEGGETGDFWSVPGIHGQRIVVDIRGQDIPVPQRRYADQAIRFDPQGRWYRGVSAGILNSADREFPRGQWNTVELMCVGQTAVHFLNGQVNLALTHARRRVDGREEPVTRGLLQLQSEGAETYFRRIRVRPLPEIPPHVLAAAGLTDGL